MTGKECKQYACLNHGGCKVGCGLPKIVDCGDGVWGCENERYPHDFTKPTAKQTAWVFEKILENAKNKGTFRKLIYDIMGYNGEEYKTLYTAGGMDIVNGLFVPEPDSCDKA